MEVSVKDQSSAPANTWKSSSKLRYPLRSVTKSKESKPLASELSNSSAPKRERYASSVSKSVGVIDLSGKDKSRKPPRRLSIPAKSNVSPVPRSVGNITLISEATAKRPVISQRKNDTPVSAVSKSSTRRKFSVLSSASYWLSQIKLSESAAKHTISLGLFKLALEAGCEPLQRMKDELKSYARKHDLAELGESAKELFETYNIAESIEQLHVSETFSQVHEEGARSFDDDDVHSTSGTGTRKLKPKSLNTDAAAKAAPIIKSAKKDTSQKDHSGARTRGSLNKNSTNAKTAPEIRGRSISNKSQRPNKQEFNKDKDKKMKKEGNKFLCEQGSANPSPTEEAAVQENKENLDSFQGEEIILTEV